MQKSVMPANSILGAIEMDNPGFVLIDQGPLRVFTMAHIYVNHK